MNISKASLTTVKLPPAINAVKLDMTMLNHQCSRGCRLTVTVTEGQVNVAIDDEIIVGLNFIDDYFRSFLYEFDEAEEATVDHCFKGGDRGEIIED